MLTWTGANATRSVRHSASPYMPNWADRKTISCWISYSSVTVFATLTIMKVFGGSGLGALPAAAHRQFYVLRTLITAPSALFAILAALETFRLNMLMERRLLREDFAQTRNMVTKSEFGAHDPEREAGPENGEIARLFNL